MRNVIALTLVAVFSVSAAGCSSKQDSGAVIGAVAGGILGNQIGQGAGRVLATAAGAVVGGIVGSEIGRSMDEADKQRAAAAEYYALEEEQVGGSRTWRNPESGHRGKVVVNREFRRNGRLCREYEHTIIIEGEPDTLTGVSCRGEDGKWRSIG